MHPATPTASDAKRWETDLYAVVVLVLSKSLLWNFQPQRSGVSKSIHTTGAAEGVKVSVTNVHSGGDGVQLCCNILSLKNLSSWEVALLKVVGNLADGLILRCLPCSLAGGFFWGLLAEDADRPNKMSN